MPDRLHPLEVLRLMPFPIHPGEYIREELMAFFKLSVSELAPKIGVSIDYLKELIKEEHSITPQAALGLSRLENSDPMLWVDGSTVLV